MLQVMGLCKHYGTLRSVQDLSFSSTGCETVGLLGPNGAGKSTTMRMLSGYLAPSAGGFTLCGLSMADHPRQVKGMIGYLPELPPLYPDCTVTEHLRFVCSLRGIAPRQAARECDRVCGLLNIRPVAGRIIGRLSKGYRQRVGFAAALIGTPRLLILDEPTVGLDPQQVIEIRRLILALGQEMTVLISSHVLSEIASVCSHLLIMNRGVLLADGSAQAIADRYRDRAILSATVRGDRALATRVLGDVVQGRGTMAVEEQISPQETGFTLYAPKELDLAPEVFQALASHSGALSLTALQAKTPTLEDVFISITQGVPLPSHGNGKEAAQA